MYRGYSSVTLASYALCALEKCMHKHRYTKTYLHFCHLLASQSLQVGQLQQVIHLHPFNALIQILHPPAAAITCLHLERYRGQYSVGPTQAPDVCQSSHDGTDKTRKAFAMSSLAPASPSPPPINLSHL